MGYHSWDSKEMPERKNATEELHIFLAHSFRGPSPSLSGSVFPGLS